MLDILVDLLFFLNLGLITVCDWKEKRVPLFLLLGLFVLSLIILYRESRLMTLSPYLTAVVCSVGIRGVGKIVKSHKKGKDALGSADVILFFILGLLIQPLMFPFILILIGVLGLMSAFIYTKLYGTEEFPFCPAICVGIFFIRMYSYDYLKDITFFR